MTDKTYHIQYNIGKARYVVSFHDGHKTHPDGSPFFDIAIFTNKRGLLKAIDRLEKQGYREAQP